MTSTTLARTPARGLLDTSVVVALDEIPRSFLPELLAISALTLAELVAGPHAVDEPIERARRQHYLQDIETSLDTIPFDFAAARAYGRVYAATRAHDRKPRGARMADLLIAAVALGEGLPLYTRNPRDFEHLQSIGLDLHAV